MRESLKVNWWEVRRCLSRLGMLSHRDPWTLGTRQDQIFELLGQTHSEVTLKIFLFWIQTFSWNSPSHAQNQYEKAENYKVWIRIKDLEKKIRPFHHSWSLCYHYVCHLKLKWLINKSNLNHKSLKGWGRNTKIMVANTSVNVNLPHIVFLPTRHFDFNDLISLYKV